MDSSCCNLLNYCISALVLYGFFIVYQKIKTRQKLNRWKKTHKDVVILHGFLRQKKVPSFSPFVLKLETYLRMANIPYKYDSVDRFGPNGKSPWISLNGEHFADTEIIIKFLSKKFEKNLDAKYSEEKLAIGTSVRVMLEEHIFWGYIRSAYVDDSSHVVTNNIDFGSNLPQWLIHFVLRRKFSNYLWGQGLGRLSSADVIMLMQKELKALATILGDNKFLLGNEPSEVDAAVFGLVAQFVFGPGTELKEYGEFVQKNHPNLVEFCKRMKERFWPDWDQCLA